MKIRDVPYITADEMRAVDQGMVSLCGISMVQMMEHAGRLLAVIAVQEFLTSENAGPIVVLAGTGGNGGGGLACARNLSNWGFNVEVVTTREDAEFWGISGLQLRIVHRIGIPVRQAEDVSELPSAQLIVDAIIGYSLEGVPTGQAARLIQLATEHPAPVLSLDIPSGIDATSGEVFTPSIAAEATLTLALPKTGFRSKVALARAGRLYLGDIGVPPSLYGELGITMHASPFAKESVIRLH